LVLLIITKLLFREPVVALESLAAQTPDILGWAEMEWRYSPQLTHSRQGASMLAAVADLAVGSTLPEPVVVVGALRVLLKLEMVLMVLVVVAARVRVQLGKAIAGVAEMAV
jgi:hypothetical protein